MRYCCILLLETELQLASYSQVHQASFPVLSLLTVNLSLPRQNVEREGELEGVIPAVQGSNTINGPECDCVSLVPF